MSSLQGNGDTLSTHNVIGPTFQAALNSNTLESSLMKKHSAPEVCGLRVGNYTLSQSAPYDSEPDDQVCINTERQVSEKEEKTIVS